MDATSTIAGDTPSRRLSSPRARMPPLAWAAGVLLLGLSSTAVVAHREWRDLQDTTNQSIMAYRAPLPYPSWQRSTDYYTEGVLLWLEVDARLRELTRERRSLDD